MCRARRYHRRYIRGGAVLELGRTEISPPFGQIFPRPRVSADPGRSSRPGQPRKTAASRPINGKRLLALWNALPGVEKRRRVGDRAALIEQLWSAIERLPDPEPRGDPQRPTKQDVVIAMLRQPEGATVDEVASVTGWQRHTVRGVFSGSLKKKLGLTLAPAKEERGQVYRIAEPASA